MARPRIRTLKPEIWQDEKVGDLSHSARLLLVGLITMADDEGRLRALSSLIVGHIFPYDDVAPAKLKRWVAELTDSELVLPYKADAKPYIVIRNWRRHQKPNRPSLSTLPEPPDEQIVKANALPEHPRFGESSVNEQGEGREDSIPRAQARGSRSVPIRCKEDPEQLPSDFDSSLANAVEECHAILKRTAETRGAKSVQLIAIARAVEQHPRKDHAAVAGSVEHWLVHGNGAKRPAKDVVARFRNFLSDAPDVEIQASKSSHRSKPATDRSAYAAVEAAE